MQKYWKVSNGRVYKEKTMSRQTISIILAVFMFLSFSSFIGAEDIPTNVTPYVRLGHLVKSSVYKNPVVRQQGDNQEILNDGELIEETIMPAAAGSGTIISPDGLILTNSHVYQMTNSFKYDSDKKILYKAAPVNIYMLVFRLQDNDPLKPPVFQYIAEPISIDTEHDAALLKIIADQDGNDITKNDFAYVNIGNPFAMKLNESLTILGYPAKGGDTITITIGNFLGYYRSERFPGLDGFIKTNAAMAPGNSGGAALNKGVLIGIPTAVTMPGQAGSDFGYIHPVTWTLKALTIANRKYGFRTPAIPGQWLASDYNTDETKDSLYVTGNIVSSHSGQALSAEVVIARDDRTIDEIKILHQQITTVNTVYLIQQLYNQGVPIKDIAERFKRPETAIEKVLTLKLAKETLPPDLRQLMEGEFFYQNNNSDEKGFFILSIPRGRKVKVYVIKEGYRQAEKDVTVGSGISQDLGTIKVFKY